MVGDFCWMVKDTCDECGTFYVVAIDSYNTETKLWKLMWYCRQNHTKFTTHTTDELFELVVKIVPRWTASSG